MAAVAQNLALDCNKIGLLIRFTQNLQLLALQVVAMYGFFGISGSKKKFHPKPQLAGADRNFATGQPPGMIRSVNTRSTASPRLRSREPPIRRSLPVPGTG
jgi:hypothetical protein